MSFLVFKRDITHQVLLNLGCRSLHLNSPFFSIFSFAASITAVLTWCRGNFICVHCAVVGEPIPFVGISRTDAGCEYSAAFSGTEEHSTGWRILICSRQLDIIA